MGYCQRLKTAQCKALAKVRFEGTVDVIFLSKPQAIHRFILKAPIIIEEFGVG